MVGVEAAGACRGCVPRVEPIRSHCDPHRRSITPQATAASVNNLAVLLMDLRRDAEALPLLRRAAGAAKAALGQNHVQYATALNNLGGALSRLGQRGAAIRRIEAALRINTEQLGEDHDSTKSTASNLRALKGASPMTPTPTPTPIQTTPPARKKRKSRRRDASPNKEEV